MKLLLSILLAFITTTSYAGGSPAGFRTSSIKFVHYSADPTVAEVGDFTAVADTAGSLAGTYFTFHTALDATYYAAWYKVSGSGVAPVVAGATLVEIDISTGDTAATVAGTSRTTLTSALPDVTVSGATTHIILTSNAKGVATDANVGTSGFTVSKTQGVSSTRLALDADIATNLVGWQVCNDGVNTSTALYISKGADPSSSGRSIMPGKCHQCEQCSDKILSQLYVSAQAASNGYSVLQFKK